MVRQSERGEAFVTGGYWTPERARAAIERMNATLASPEFQRVMLEAPETPPAEMPGAVAGAEPARSGPIALERCVFRRAIEADVPELAWLIAAGNLPPLFIEEFLGGFVVVEHEGEAIGGGALEMYEDCGVLRSIVVAERAQGLGLGRRMAELLMDDARLSGARDVYLFTADAHPFWLRLGFRDVTFEEWREPARACWQYVFLSQNRNLFDVHTMWKRV